MHSTVSFIHSMNIYTTKKYIKSFGFRIQKHIKDSNLLLDIIKQVTTCNSTVPPWKLIKPDVDTYQNFKKIKQILLC